ncbi:glycosyl hydrolase [Novosphingobium pokkalii]|uniref:glycosyl hydrolase n=1 Tax=Novosphingobium pokkalii TaxID=1770194 RepID=UPI00363CB333
MIGTGFLRPLFAAGLLAQVDGIAVHPYRNRAEGLDAEMSQLWAAMDASGRRVPVWATEFGLATADQGTAAGELVKQATMLAASGVGQASWYALIDQTGFPTMGLFAGSAIKDQGRAFRFLQASVLPKGRPPGWTWAIRCCLPIALAAIPR